MAQQLATALTERGYGVFLDTRSVDEGRLFQPALWDNMADTDLVLFLDTRKALQSRWVAKEFARAAELGISVLHLVWPGRAHLQTSTFSELSYLEDADFLARPSPVGGRARLRISAVERVVQQVESLRARAWHLRHATVVGAFLRRLRGNGRDPIVDPEGGIHVTSRSRRTAVVLPVLGIPRSPDFERAQQQARAVGEGQAWVLYQRRSLSRRTQAHIDWLGKHLPVKTLDVDEVPAWLAGS